MSYILDALQKAERDRDLARVPDLRTVPFTDPGRTRRVGLWALVLALLVGAGVSVWLLVSSPTVQRPVPGEAHPPSGTRYPEGGGDLHRALARLEAALAPPSTPEGAVPAKPETGHKEKGPSRSGHSGSGATPAAALPTAPASPDLRPVRPWSLGEAPTEARPIQAEPTEPQADRSPAPEQKSMLPEAASPPRSQVPPAVQSAPPPAEPQADRSLSRGQQQTTPQAAVSPGPQAPTGPQGPQVPPVVQSAPPPAEPIARPSPPPPANLPTLQEAVSKMKLGVFVYTEAKAKRMVVIDGRSYGEGDLVNGRYLVEAITSEGVVLSRDGERALLKP